MTPEAALAITWKTPSILSCSKDCDGSPHLRLVREMLTSTFGTPRGHPKSKPFVDHVFQFSYCDGRIWFRNYQLVDAVEHGSKDARRAEKAGLASLNLVEIGPRFVLNPIIMFQGSFGGPVTYRNKDYVSPNTVRAQERAAYGNSYAQRKASQKRHKRHQEANPMPEDELAGVFS